MAGSIFLSIQSGANRQFGAVRSRAEEEAPPSPTEEPTPTLIPGSTIIFNPDPLPSAKYGQEFCFNYYIANSINETIYQCFFDNYNARMGSTYPDQTNPAKCCTTYLNNPLSIGRHDVAIKQCVDTNTNCYVSNTLGQRSFEIVDPNQPSPNPTTIDSPTPTVSPSSTPTNIPIPTTTITPTRTPTPTKTSTPNPTKTPTPTPKTIVLSINNAADDGYQTADSNRKMYFNTADIKLGWYMSRAGFRFSGPNIADLKNKTIKSAALDFTSSSNSKVNIKVSFRGQNSDSCNPFSFASNDLGLRLITVDSVGWNITDTWGINSRYTSPDLKNIIQKIVKRPSFTGESICLFIDNAGSSNYTERLISAKDSVSRQPVTLTITYY